MNGSPSRPQDDSSSSATMTRRSPRNTADYDLVFGLPSIHKVPKLDGMPPSPSISRPSFTHPFKKRRRKSTNITQPLLTLEKSLFLGWFACFSVGFFVLYHLHTVGSDGSILSSGLNSGISDRTPTPGQYVRSRSPQDAAPQPKPVKSKPPIVPGEPSDPQYTNTIPNEDVGSDEETASGNGMDDESSEEPPVVHIIHSRFMQHQPQLIELGLARLALMNEFFLPSLRSQSSQNFLCVIRIDPDLNATVKDALLEAMETSGGDFNYLIVASNANPNSEYLDILKTSEDSEFINIVSGNYTAAKEYMMKSQNIIETRLDVDDGLNQFFVEEMQEEAMDHFDSYPKHENNSPWKVWCSSTHFQWQFQPAEMWEAKEENPQTAPPNATGSLLSIRSTVCITAGLSVAYVAPSEDEEAPELPSTLKHTTIHRDLPKCGTRKAKKHHPSGGCFDFFDLIPTAIRARSPTSAGMYGILWPHRNHENSTTEDPVKLQDQYLQEAKRQADKQAKFWNASEYYFDFGETSASRVHAYLADHMKEIAEENLLGQCTHGHSCKNSSRLVLESILKDY